MATNTQLITKPFSRQLNGLAELQRGWPAYVKADGIGGLTVDPILLATSFGPDPESADGRRHDESTMPGIRVESLNDDGSIPSTVVAGVKVYARVVITGSGGFKPICSLLTPDGTSTKVMLIAPSAERKTAVASPSQSSTILTDIKAASPGSSRHSLTVAQTDTNKPGTTGPYPVFMTVQELAEWIDTARHIGAASDSGKKAWLPHGIIGREVAATNARVDVDADPRFSSNNNFSATSYWRATVFMPMMLDVNQFSMSISGAENANATLKTATVGGAEGTYLPNCVTRYPGNQTDLNNATTPVNNVKWKTFNYSGDHLTGVNYGGTKEQITIGDTTYPGFQNIDISNDSTASVGPKYRMKMALACFLKDGDYNTNEGVIIPYTYDPARYLGGTTTTTLYTVWDGDNGYGSPVDGTYDSTNYRPHQNDKSAQVYPMFDFVQGPIAPSAQGSNWAHDVLVKDYHKGSMSGTYLPRQAHTRPNPARFEIVKTIWNEVGSTMTVWLFGGYTADSGGVSVTPGSFRRGDAIYIEGMEGNWGGQVITNRDAQKWPARFEKGRGNQTELNQYRSFNGWWLIKNAVNYTELQGEDHEGVQSDQAKSTVLFLLHASEATTVKPIGGMSISKCRLGPPRRQVKQSQQQPKVNWAIYAKDASVE